MMARPLLLIVSLFVLGVGGASLASKDIAVPVTDQRALADAVHDLCGKRVALLGEATHGDGHTDAFKAALVERLVTRCHFNAIFFEASHYEFLGFTRKLRNGESVDQTMVAAAVGGLWKFDREVQPLIPFLFDAAKAKHVTLGGIDGQLGVFESSYANDVMPVELTSYLEPSRRADCRETLRQRTHWDYPASPYSDADRIRILQCTADISRALDKASTPDAAEAELRSMIRNIEAFTRADALRDASFIGARDEAMYDNFRWLAARLPARSKIIVWSATAHVAKDARADPRFASITNFGALLHRDYGSRAFALGFSAASGSYRYSRKDNRPLETPPAGALESSTMSRGVTAYLGPARLAKVGTVPGAFFSHSYHTNRWSDALDGAVVFDAEFPPHSTRPGY
jgi:erythromycin esterase-like protein